MGLVRNVGSTDKIIRLVLAAVLIAWGILGAGISSVVGIVAVVAGAILIATAVLNFCPVFRILGISSFKGAKS